MASSAVEQSPCNVDTSRRREEQDCSLKEWALRTQISRENTKSRRFSGTYIRRYREDTRSFRSNITISSAASSPGYSLREEIDPSTYSFTTALKALQVRSGYSSWECLSPDGFALNSKWNEAEKYICDPQSGEVPVECLSAKTLSGRSFKNPTSRITMSAPLVCTSQYSSSRQIHAKPSIAHATSDDIVHFLIREHKMEGTTRDAGTQSTPPELSSSSPCPASTPPNAETSLKRSETESGGSPNCHAKLQDEQKAQVNETRGKGDSTKRGCDNNKDDEQMWRCSRSKQGGCLSWMMRKRRREKHKTAGRKRSIFRLLSVKRS